MQRVALVPHPSTRSTHVRGVFASVAVRTDGAIALSFRVEGPVDRLQVPSRAVPTRADGLWRHTCFEAFVQAGGGPGYCELNFSPSGEWAAYAFRRYRDPEILQVGADPMIVVEREAHRLDLRAVARVADLPAWEGWVALRLGLSAVLEDRHGALSYWALRHPAGAPDFHHRDAFALTLAPSSRQTPPLGPVARDRRSES